MEPAKIDWKTIDSVFIRDDAYENINAPQWIDFLVPDDGKSVDDEAWFCKPDCKHPKTAEDFLKSTPTSASKLLRSVAVSKLINGLGDWNRRDANLKRRGQAHLSYTDDDSENLDPNLHSPPPHNQVKSLKEAIKSSAERNNADDGDDKQHFENEETPIRQLKSTLSARDLFGAGGGKDIFGKITDFCNELKKRIATTRLREKEGEDRVVEGKKESLLFEVVVKETEGEEAVSLEKENGGGVQSSTAAKERRKPFGEVRGIKDRLVRPAPAAAAAAAAAGEDSNNNNGSLNRPRRKKRVDDDRENKPVSLDLKNIKGKEEERLLQIRTSPPTPQCFSATKTTTTTPSKGPKSRIMDKDTMLLQQQEDGQQRQNNKVFSGEEKTEKEKPAAAAAEGGRTTLDVFWFLKPCATLSS